MTTSFLTRAAGLGALVLSMSVVTAVSPALVLAAGTSGDELVIADPLPGYTHAEGSALDGPIDVAQLMILNGVDAKDVPDFAANFKGQARTWHNAAGSVAAVMVIDCGDEHSATDFLSGALGAQTKAGADTFESGMSGSLGYTVHQPAAIVHTVIWRQGKYFVEVFGAISGAAGTTQEDAKALAVLQAEFLRPITDAEPTADVANATASQDSSVAYQLGKITGWLLIPGIVTVVVVRRKRRRQAEQAHQAMFAVPPPPFRPLPLSAPPLPAQPSLPLPPPPLPQPWAGFAPPTVN